jgi:hypothetical protein
MCAMAWESRRSGGRIEWSLVGSRRRVGKFSGICQCCCSIQVAARRKAFWSRPSSLTQEKVWGECGRNDLEPIEPGEGGGIELKAAVCEEALELDVLRIQ